MGGTLAKWCTYREGSEDHGGVRTGGGDGTSRKSGGGDGVVRSCRACVRVHARARVCVCHCLLRGRKHCGVTAQALLSLSPRFVGTCDAGVASHWGQQRHGRRRRRK